MDFTKFKQAVATKFGSFVEETKAVDAIVQLKFALVLHLIKTRLAENEATRMFAAKAEQKQKLLGLIAQKQDEALGSKSLEELTAMVNSL